MEIAVKLQKKNDEILKTVFEGHAAAIVGVYLLDTNKLPVENIVICVLVKLRSTKGSRVSLIFCLKMQPMIPGVLQQHYLYNLEQPS